MRKEYSVLRNLMLSMLAMGVIINTPVCAAEKTQAKDQQEAKMPPPPAGPYRSTGNSASAVQIPEQLVQRSQPPAPPAWVQERRAQPMQPPAPPAWVQQRHAQPMQPPAPPAWVQERRPQPMQPPAWVQERRANPLQPPAPPAWVQQRRANPMQRPEPPAWVTQRQSNAPQNQWPGYQPYQGYPTPPAWGYAPHSQFRR